MKYLSLLLFVVLLVVTVLFTIEVNYWKQKAIHYAIEIKYIHKLVTDITRNFDFKIKPELIHRVDTSRIGGVYWHDSDTLFNIVILPDTVDVIYYPVDSIIIGRK